MTPPLFDFPRLNRAVEIVRQAHPRAFEPVREVPQSDLTKLIERVLAASPREYDELAASLTQREATILVHAYARRMADDKHAAVTEVLVRRPVARQLGQAWMIFRTQPGLDALRTGMRRIGAAIAEREHVRDDATAFLLRVWKSADIDKALVEEVESAGTDLETWCAYKLPAELTAELNGPLHNRMRGNVVVYGGAALFERYKAATIAEWFAYIPENRYDAAAVNYIQQLDARAWSISIIENCVSKHGLPAAGGAFWTRIDPAKREVIQNLVAGRLIANFFEDISDPQGRFRFWRRYANRLITIAYPHNRERVLLHFKGFIVVEFRDLGNAGYVYPERTREAIEMRVMGAGSHGSCKIPELAVHRIIHNQQWQRNTKEALDRNIG